VGDDAAIAAWSALAPYLRRIGEQSNRSDSPVDAVMEVAQWGAVRRRTVPDPRWDSLRQQLALARDIGDPALMLEVLDGAAGLDEASLQVLRAEAGVGLVRLGRYEDARRLLSDVVERDSDVLRPEAHLYYAQALYRPKNAPVESYDAAERVLRRVLLKRPVQPEVRAMIGAIAKRRAGLRQTAAQREPDLRLAMDSYRYDYERQLNAFYEGINVIAVAVALHLRYGDESAGDRARELLPAVRLAAALALRAAPNDYWAAATVAECGLYESLLGVGGDSFAEGYRVAGALRPRSGDLDATLFQLDFLRMLELPAEPIAAATQALLTAAGVPDPAHS
jgi:hypothetical protein